MPLSFFFLSQSYGCRSLSPLCTDIRSLPDVAMTGNCTTECSELGHSDACWMPGHPSPVRKTRNPPKLSTFVPYQERGSLGRLANGSARLGGEEHRPRLPPSRSAYSNSGHDASQDCPLEEMPLSVASEFPPTSPSAHTPKREIYLWGGNLTTRSVHKWRNAPPTSEGETGCPRAKANARFVGNNRLWLIQSLAWTLVFCHLLLKLLIYKHIY